MDDYSDFESLLRIYYERLFPFRRLYQWLNDGSEQHPNSLSFSNREFSFTLQDDVYLRFQSFNSESEFQERVLKLVPYKIDVGAVYTARPSERKFLGGSVFRPVEKELVFDIDMTDYDEVRQCCKDKQICDRCWKFIVVAVKIIDVALVEDFGFKNRLWVFSGRRGIHCWVSDETARNACASTRRAVVNYLEVVRGGDDLRKKVLLPTNSQLHPSLQRAKKIVEEYFEQIILEDQDFLKEQANREKVLHMVADETLRGAVKRRWEGQSCGNDSKSRWSALIDEHSSACENLGSGGQKKFAALQAAKLKHAVTEIMFQLLYPRLDVNVSMQLGHLLKAPFCIHPATGNVCVPLTAESVASFDPTNAPNLSSLIREIDTSTAATGNDVLKTSLKPFIDVFSKFLTKLEMEKLQRRKPDSSSF